MKDALRIHLPIKKYRYRCNEHVCHRSFDGPGKPGSILDSGSHLLQRFAPLLEIKRL